MFSVVTTGRTIFMEKELMDETQILKDSIVDRIHDLVSMGDYLNACAVYEEFKENFAFVETT